MTREEAIDTIQLVANSLGDMAQVGIAHYVDPKRLGADLQQHLLAALAALPSEPPALVAPAVGSPLPLEHWRSCAELTGGECTCGLGWRVRLVTEQEMHAAWRKRAEESEAAQPAGDVPPLPTAAPAPVERPTEKAPLPCPECREVDRVWSVGDGRYRCAACDVGYTAHDSPAALAPSPETVSVSRGQLHAWLDNIVNASRDIDAGHATTALLRLVVRRIEADIAALSPPETAPKGGQ